MLRIAISLILSLMLVATSHSMGQARGANPAVDRMVICAGAQAVVVYIDGSGQPTQAPHICPDCALHAVETGAAAVFGMGAAPVFSHHAAAEPPLDVHSLRHGRATARAPPVLI